MYSTLIHYPHLKVLDRPLKRLETWTYNNYLNNNVNDFVKNYDDAHFHRSYNNNEMLILHAEKNI